jgi:hypothetical protein
MADNNNRPQQPWNIFDHWQLALAGEEWPDQKGKKPSLKFVVHENNARFRLYMRDGKVKDAIPFKLDPHIFGQLCEALLMIAADKNPNRIMMDIKSGYDHKNNKTEKPGTVAKLWAGRDSDGVIYLALQAKGEQMVKFPFLPSWFADLHGADGEKLDKGIASELCTRSYVNNMRTMMINYMVAFGKAPKEKPGSGKGYSGNSGGNNKSGDWNKQPTAEFTADEEFSDF